MHFKEIAIPESTYWIEKSDILFMLDSRKGNTTFVSNSLFDPSKIKSSQLLDILKNRIHPGDLPVFTDILDGHKYPRPDMQIRILDRARKFQSFRLCKLKAGPGHDLLFAVRN